MKDELIEDVLERFTFPGPLKIRAINVALNNGVTTIEQLHRTPPSEVRKWKDIGERTMGVYRTIIKSWALDVWYYECVKAEMLDSTYR